MKIAVIGASAGVGLELVLQLLERGHSVTTLSRGAGALPEHPSLRQVRGSSLNVADIALAIDGAQAVLVTLGTGMSTKATGLYPASARALLEALSHQPGKPTLIVLTGFGAGESWSYNSLPMKIMFTLLLKDIYAEKTQMEQMIAQAWPNATFVRPGRLTNGPLTGRYRVLTQLDRSTRVGAISRKDVAHFMAGEAEQPRHPGQYPALTG